LDLFYLLTAYGESDFHAEILLGYAMQIMHETPVLTRDAIRKALGGPGGPVTGTILPTDFKMLVAAELAEQVEQIKITPQSMNTEEMSKLWTALQTPYRPTAAYQVSVVLIEARRPIKRTLPVLEPIVCVTTFQQPVIESVADAADPSQPIVADSTLLIKGRQLRGENTNVVFGGISFTPVPPNLGSSQIRVPLPLLGPAALRAGIQSVQVVQQVSLGKPSVPHQGIESNVAAFILHPKIAVPPNASGYVVITFDPKVEKHQRVTLFLGECNPPPGRPARSFNIAAPVDNGITVPAQSDTATIRFLLPGVDAGKYLVRVQVDGAESLLTLDNVAGSTTFNQFNGPQVTIT
jgi:hypothetical protein